MPVIHLHGRMRYLPGQVEGDFPSRPFTVDVSKALLSMSANGIKIIHEKVDPAADPDFRAARELLHAADRIYVMGLAMIGRTWND
jgi:hypothetical protein